MPQISTLDTELVATVVSHLEQLHRVAAHDAREATMRVASGSLRFLLADGNLARAWRITDLGGPITVRAWCIDTVGPAETVAFCGGGDIIPGIPVSACRGATLKEKTLDLAAFCKSTRVQVGQTKISTVEFIQYVANARGGSHFDPTGKASKKAKGEILAKLQSGEIQCVPLKFNDRTLFHHEILSIVQALVRSPEVAKLLSWKQC